MSTDDDVLGGDAAADPVESYWDAEPVPVAADVGRGVFGTADVPSRRTPVCARCELPRFGETCPHCTGSGPWQWPHLAVLPDQPAARTPARAAGRKPSKKRRGSGGEPGPVGGGLFAP